jgi:hypothetical protein
VRPVFDAAFLFTRSCHAVRSAPVRVSRLAFASLMCVAPIRRRRFDQVDARFAHFDATSGQMDMRFAWLIGFQFATFMTIIAALLNGYFR